MKLKHFKNILELVSTSGLITEFVIKKDGSVRQKTIDNTLLVDLKYKDISLDFDIGVDDTTKLRNILGRFSNEAEVSTDGKSLKIVEGNKRGSIPLVNVDEENLGDISVDFAVKIDNVDLKRFRNSANNKVKELHNRFVFTLKEGKLELCVGEEDTGIICETIAEDIQHDTELQSVFALNIKEIANTIKENPTIEMGNDYPMRIGYETDDYTVEYTVAPLVE